MIFAVLISGCSATGEPASQPAPTPAAESPRALRTLWLGSSSLYFNDMPQAVGDWLVAAGKTPAYKADLAGRSGAGVHVYLRPNFKADYGLAGGQTVLEKIRDGRYDLVVIQMVARFIIGEEGDEHDKSADAYCRAARAAGGEPVFYEMGWGAQEPDDQGRQRIFQAAVRNRVRFVAPCSTAWKRVRAERGDIELHNLPDRVHPGDLGFYLNLCCFYAALTGQAPSDVPTTVHCWARIPKDQKDAVKKKLAGAAVTDPYVASLPAWMRLNHQAGGDLQVDSAVARYLQKVAWETWQAYAKRLKAAGITPGPK